MVAPAVGNRASSDAAVAVPRRRASAGPLASAGRSVVIALTYLWLPFMVLPIYTGLVRLPASLLDASGDLGAHPLRTFRSVVLPMLLPSIAAGSIFTFSLSLGDFIIPQLVIEGNGADDRQHHQPHAAALPTSRSPPPTHCWPLVDRDRLPDRDAQARSLREPLIMHLVPLRPHRARRDWTWLTLVFLYLPLLVIAILSFNTATSLSLATARIHHQVVGAGVERRRAARRADQLGQAGTGGDADRIGDRDAGGVRHAAFHVLRQAHVLVRARAADRAARHRHRDRPAQHVRPHDPGRRGSGSASSRW